MEQGCVSSPRCIAQRLSIAAALLALAMVLPSSSLAIIVGADSEDIQIATTIESSFDISVGANGLIITETTPLPPEIVNDPRTFPAWVFDEEADLVDLLDNIRKDYGLTIDGQTVSTPTGNASDESGSWAYHEAEFGFGKHTITITDPSQIGNPTLYDGDILINGLSQVRITIKECSTETGNVCDVVVSIGGADLFDSRDP